MSGPPDRPDEKGPAPGDVPPGEVGAEPGAVPPGEESAPPLTPLGRLRRRLREPPSYWLVRFLLLRLLGLVYLFAFLSIARQIVPLIGSDGLLPIQPLLDVASDQLGSSWRGFFQSPSLFWLGAPDAALEALAWAGVGLSLAVLAGYANALILAALWALYFSFVTIGQDWFAYGWDSQLCETGFLAMFLVPLLDARPFPRRRPPKLVILLFRWLVLRIMLGAGLIKLRGDPCWEDLSCLATHFETQPLPNPLSRAAHLLPDGVLAFGVIVNHVSELIAPLFVFGPRRARLIAGLVMVGFQLVLIATGNLSLLNWLTIVPILACFDDQFLARFTPRRLRERIDAARSAAAPSRAQRCAVAALFAVYLVLSVQPLINLISSDQKMNYSFNRLHVASAYGAFGSMFDQRIEIVFEGTAEATDPPGGEATWHEYEFPCKPGDPMRRPCIAAPFQYRLDWQLWFASRASIRDYPWTAHLVWKLLHNDPTTLRLLSHNPFPAQPPRRIRALLYRYHFAAPDNPTGAWWHRQLLTTWFPPVSAADPALIHFLQLHRWLPARPPRPAAGHP
jgi:Lipase maturation factor